MSPIPAISVRAPGSAGRLMNYRSIAELSDDVVDWSRRLPPDFDLVVGIPRSGLLVATLLALHRNLPMTDVDGLIAGRVLGSGHRLNMTAALTDGRRLRILVVDDSLWSGKQMEKARSRIAMAALAHDIFFGAVYVVPGAANRVDFHCRTVPLPRVFEWNVLHHPHMLESCVAAEGVLWSAATGPVAGEHPLVVPTQVIGTLVAVQPEAMRPFIEDWLARHDIRYRELLMVPPGPGDADGSNPMTARKAFLYRRRKARLFVEAGEADAAALANAAGRPVYSAVTRRMVYPGCRQDATRYTARMRDRLIWFSRDLVDRITGKIRRLCRRSGPGAAARALSAVLLAFAVPE